MTGISESDWKKLRSMKNDALNLACDRIFEKVEKIAREKKGKEHESYLKLWKLIQDEDRTISIMFDDVKRSNAVHKLATWKLNGVISEDDFCKFSSETQKIVNSLNEILR